MTNVVYPLTGTVDAEARNAATTADAKAQTALDEVAKLSDLAYQDTIRVSQIDDPAKIPSSDRNIDEYRLSPVSQKFRRLSDKAFAYSDAPATEPTNSGWQPDEFTEQWASIIGDATLLGVPGKRFDTDDASYHGINISKLSSGTPAGTRVVLAGIIDILGQTPGYADDSFKVWLSIEGALEARGTCHFRGDDAGRVLLSSNDWTEASLVDSDQPGSASYVSAAIDGTKHIFVVEWQTDAETTNDAYVRINPSEANVIADVTCLAFYLDGSTFRHDAGDDTAKVQIPGDSGEAMLTLTTAANQKATIDAASTRLVLPSPPTSGVRDMILRAAVSSGSLSLPSSGVRTWGASGPFSSDVRLGIRQYSDGSSADIFAARAAS